MATSLETFTRNDITYSNFHIQLNEVGVPRLYADADFTIKSSSGATHQYRLPVEGVSFSKEHKAAHLYAHFMHYTASFVSRKQLLEQHRDHLVKDLRTRIRTPEEIEALEQVNQDLLESSVGARIKEALKSVFPCCRESKTPEEVSDTVRILASP